MAHFAELDGDNKVLRVCVVDNAHVPSDKHADGETWCTNFWGGTWKQTSYNSNFRKQFAGIDFTYDATRPSVFCETSVKFTNVPFLFSLIRDSSALAKIRSISTWWYFVMVSILSFSS